MPEQTNAEPSPRRAPGIEVLGAVRVADAVMVRAGTPFLEHVVARVFPEGTRLVEPGDAQADNYHLISDRSGPRWLLPANPRLGLPYFSSWPCSGRHRYRLMWSGLRLAYRAGLLQTLPALRRLAGGRPSHGDAPWIQTVAIATPRSASWDHLGWCWLGASIPVIYIGRPHSFQKATVGLVASQDTQLKVVAKIGLRPNAVHKIRNEAAMLEHLSRERPGLAPTPLHVDLDRSLILLSPVLGRPCGRHMTRAYWRFLMALRRRGETVSLGALAASCAADIAASGLENEEDARIVHRTLRGLEQAPRFPAFVIHGDLGPWNLRRGADGEIVAFDWEHGQLAGLPLQDLIYFFYSQALFVERRPGLQAIRDHSNIFYDLLDEISVDRRHLAELVQYRLASSWLAERLYGNRVHARAYVNDLRTLWGKS